MKNGESAIFGKFAKKDARRWLVGDLNWKGNGFGHGKKDFLGEKTTGRRGQKRRVTGCGGWPVKDRIFGRGGSRREKNILKGLDNLEKKCYTRIGKTKW